MVAIHLGGSFESLGRSLLGKFEPRICSHRIHGNGIFTYIWLIFMVNVGKYTIQYMDPMGFGVICLFWGAPRS